MSYFDQIKRDIEELLQLVRESEQYAAAVRHDPDLLNFDSPRVKNAERSVRICELQKRLGVNA